MVEAVQMGLIKALGVKKGEAVFLTGAGGKTAALRELAYEGQKWQWPVVLGTTAKVSASEFDSFPVIRASSDIAGTADQVRNAWERGEVPFLAGGFLPDRAKYSGVDPVFLSSLYRELEGFTFFIEADGSRNLPCKVPGPNEPVLADIAGLVVFVLGADAINRPLNESVCYNSGRAVKILEEYQGDERDSSQLTLQVLSRLVLSENGGRKGVLRGQRFTVFINKVENYYERRAAFQLGEILEKNGVPTVKGSLKMQVIYSENVLPVAVVLLAAGKSSRMGRPKQLLPCPGGNFLDASVNLYRPFGQVVVVLGYQAERIRRQSELQDSLVVVNDSYREGMSTSLQAGYREVRDTGIEGILVAFCDMPHLKPRTVEQVLAAAAESPGKIIIPVYRGKGGHPVYIPRRFFYLLETVEGDEGARSIIKNYPDEVRRIPVEDYAVTTDIDSEETYRLIREKEGW